nr:mucin-17-like isoform X19 [Misgurnus anguillicaudatus]
MTVTPETSTSHPTSPKGMNPNRPVTPQHKKSTTTRPKASTVITMNSNTVQKSSVPTSTVTPKTTLKSPETTNAHSAITTAPSIMTPTHMSTSSATTPLTIAPSSIQSAKITPKDSTTVTVTPETSTNHPTSHKPNPSATPTSPKSTRPEASTIITMNSNTMQKLSVHTSPLTTTLKSSETTNAHSEILTSSGITSAYPTTTPLQEPVIFPQTSNGTSHQNDQTKTSTKSPTTMHPSISTTKTATATTSVTPALHSPTKTTRQTFSASPTKKPIGTTISTAIKTSPLPTYTTTAMPKKTTFLNKTPVLTSNLPPVTVPKSTPKVTGSEMVTSLGTTHAYPKTTPLQEPVIIPQTSNGTSHQNDQTKTSTKSPTTMHPSISTTKTATATTSATPVLHLPTQTPHQTSSASPTTKPIAKTTSAAIKTMHSSISTTKTATAKTSVTPVLSSATQTAHQTSSASSTTKNTLTAVTSPTPFTTYTSTTMHKTTSFSKTSPVLTSTLGTKPKSTPKGTVFTSSGATYTYLTTKTLQEPVIIPQTSNETSHPNIPTCKCGIAVVTSTLRFNSSSPVPSQDLVLNAISDLQNSRESQLIESVKVLNITYEKISETSYEVKLTFAVSNITIPVDKEQTNSTLKNLQDVVNVAVNTLLNEPGKAPLQPNSSSFQSTPNQINGVLNYIIQDGNAVQPVSFLQKLQSLMGSSTTSASPLTTSSSPVTSGSAVVTSTLQFNSSSPVPSQDLVLKAISDLRNSRESQLNESVKLLNVTYKKISETSYEIKLTFAVSNVSMPVDIKQRNSTFTHLQDVVKLAVNTLLNEPGKAPLQPNSSSFQSTPNQINGSLNYIIRDGDAIQPVSFLQKLQSLKGSSTTSASPLTSSSPVTSVKFVSGSAVVTSTLQFNSPSSVPSKDLVLKAISDLRNSRESQLNESVKLLNVTYEKISENSYEVKLTFAVSNVSMPVDIKQRNSTLKHLEDVVNVAVNTLLNEPGKVSLQPNSSSFQETPNQINGSLNYIIRDGDAIQPVSFLQKLQSLKESSTTSASPLTTSSSPVRSGSAVVTSTLQFNSSSPVPSQDLVLKAISDLRNSRESQLNESVKLLNVTYEKISENSYKVQLTFAVSNVSMPVDIKQRNSTFTHLQDVANVAVNTLLNEPGKATLQPNSSSFQSTPNQINGSLNYIIRDGDAIQPVSFLQKLQSLKGSSTTSASPLATSSSPVTSGSAVVTSTLQFNSSSPVPSQDLVLKAISDLRNSRESQLNESVKLLNVTYEKISENSYEVKLTFAVSNVSMPVDIKQRNSTFTHLQDVVNVAVNTLLNEPGKASLQPNSSSFLSTPNHINGSLNYIIRNGDAIQPVSFLQKLQSLKGSSTTSASPLATSSSPVTSGSAVVTSTLQFNSSSPVPSKDLVLKAISDLRNSRESQLNESVKLLNVTYEKISETSYEVKLTFAVSNVSMPVDIKQRNSTFTHLQDVANVAVNTLLNEPGKASLQPNSSSFQSTPNHINGSLNYIIHDGDAIQPISFLQKLQSLKGSSTTSASPLATSSSPVTSGSAVVTSTLQFNSSSPVPSKDLVLKAISDLRNSRESQLNESVKLLNVTYEKISETSYEVKFTFAVSNVSMPVDIKQRNSTIIHLQDVVNVAVNTLLNEPGKAPLQPNSSSFQSTQNQINGSLNYIIRDGDAIQPVSFLQKLQSLKGSSTTSASPLATSSSPVTSGSAVVTSTLQFNSSSPVPSQDLVLKAISDLRNSRESQLNESVKLLNVTYEKISENSYEVKLTFAVSNVSMPVDIKQRNSTFTHLQDVVNVAVNTLLNEPGKASLQPNSSSFQSTPNHINGSLNYIIRDGDAIQPVSFLQKLQSLKGSSTTSASPLATSSSPVTSGSAVVTSTLQFNSSSPVPSQDLVLKAISDLRNSRESQLNESVKLLNVTYEKISETSYEVKFTFAVSNVSMPVDIKQRNSTIIHLQDVVNVAVNTLLNEPGKASLQPNSSSFESTPNHINGSLNYIIRDGDAIQPVSFLQKLQSLKGSSTTSASPLTTSSSPVTSGSAVVTSTLQFNSSSPVPSKDLVLKAISDLRNSRESQLNESVKLLNVTYEKISENSYEIKLTFAVSNVSMPVDIKQKNSTFTHLQDVVNVAVNTLLNEPGKASLQPNSSSFLSTPNHINGSLNYIIRDGDAIQPVSFLQKLQSLKGSSTTSASPLATSSSPVTSGSAVVTSTLQFNSSSPVPSKDLVLKAISDLRNSRESQLNESVKLLNVTYEKISETSYEVKFTFAVSNFSMPVDIKQRNSTIVHLQDVVNVAVNTLLNEPGKAPLQPNSSSFLSTPNQINGSLNYIIRDGNAIQPVSFQQKLQSLKGSSTTSASPLTTSSSPVKSGSAVVTSTLQFNSSSPVPSQDLVLKAISDLRNSRESQLNESVKLLNVTYEKISENSYKVQLTFAVSNVSMPVDIKQRNSTFTHLQDVVNVAVNTLLNEPGKVSLQPNSSSFQSTPNQINGLLNYIIQDGDAIQPVSFLQKFQSLKGSSTTSASPLTSSSPVNFVLGSAVVTSTLQFNSLSPVPSQDLVYKAISDLRSSRESKLNEPVKLVNVSYTKTSETSYAVLLTFVLSNISMPEKPELRNNTFQLVQDITNNALNTLLNEPGNANLKPNSSNFSSTQNQIVGNMEYDFQTEDTIKPISFLNNLQLPPGLTTTNTPMTNTTSLGDVIIYIRLVFITVKSAPNESTVLQLAYSLLAARLRTKRDVQQLNDPVSFVDVTYQRISDKVFALNFGYIINNVTITQNPVLKNQTLGLVQKSINKLLNEILSSPTATPYQFKQANFTGNSTVIRADVEYVFSDNEITAPSPFIKELILKVNGSITSAPATTTFYPTVVATTGRNNSTSAAWVVAIIVPCAIAIMLIPCWILLCCLLCGCCAGVRRRWDRRRSYNIRYYIHNL